MYGIINWQNVLWTHYASAHGGLVALITNNVGLNYLEMRLMIDTKFGG